MFPVETTCPKTPYSFVKSLKYGISTVRAHFRPPIICCLLAVDYVLKWVEAKAIRTNDSKVVVDFVKSLFFVRFGMPRAMVSDRGKHFCNRVITALLCKYGVIHKTSTSYHPQTNG